MNASATTAPIAPPEPSEFAAELIERRQRRQIPRTTLVLAALVVVGAVFFGGIEAQKSLGTSSSTGTAGSAVRAGGVPSGFPAFARGGAAGGNPGASGAGTGAGFGFNATSGTVTLIKGSTLYVTDVSGNTMLVKTSGTTSVTKTTSARVSSIRPGDTLSFVGTQKSDGSFAPRAITVTSASNG